MMEKYVVYEGGVLPPGNYVKYEDHQREVDELRRKLDLANNHIKEAYQNGKKEGYNQGYEAGARALNYYGRANY